MVIRRLGGTEAIGLGFRALGRRAVNHFRDLAWLSRLFLVAAACASAWWGTQVIRQAATLGYSATQGAVLDSYATAHRSKSGVSHTAHVLYTYTLAGQTHTSHRFAYAHNGPVAYGKDWAEAHQPGSDVTVYYDPSTPGEAVLRQGLMWRDPIAFAISLAALFLSGGIVGCVRSKLKNARLAGGRLVFHLDESRVAISLAPRSAWIVGCAAGGVVALAGTILLGTLVPDSFGVIVGVQACVIVMSLLIAAGVYRFVESRRRCATRLLVIDQTEQTLTIPTSDSGGQPKLYRFEDVHGFEVEKVTSRSGRYNYVHHCVVMSARENGSDGRLQVHRLSTDVEAISLTNWLNASVGAHGGKEEHRAMAG